MERFILDLSPVERSAEIRDDEPINYAGTVFVEVDFVQNPSKEIVNKIHDDAPFF